MSDIFIKLSGNDGNLTSGVRSAAAMNSRRAVVEDFHIAVVNLPFIPVQSSLCKRFMSVCEHVCVCEAAVLKHVRIQPQACWRRTTGWCVGFLSLCRSVSVVTSSSTLWFCAATWRRAEVKARYLFFTSWVSRGRYLPSRGLRAQVSPLAAPPADSVCALILTSRTRPV